MEHSANPYRGVLIAIGLCLIFMAITATLGTLGYFHYLRNVFHFWIIATVLLPSLVYIAFFVVSPGLRRWTHESVDLAMLTLPHAWRTVGFCFLVLWYFGMLPAGFAAPAGFGDFVIGMAAPFVAVALWQQWRHAYKAAAWFHALGFLDLFIAILTGVTGFGALPEQMHLTDPMTAFPMVIIPTVFVPLLVLSHVMAWVKIFGWGRAAD